MSLIYYTTGVAAAALVNTFVVTAQLLYASTCNAAVTGPPHTTGSFLQERKKQA